MPSRKRSDVFHTGKICLYLMLPAEASCAIILFVPSPNLGHRNVVQTDENFFRCAAILPQAMLIYANVGQREKRI